MRTRHKLSLVWLGMMLACASLLAACTKGGQFDPTSLLDNDMFDTKKPLHGQREPVFPGGVPGATTGIPADLYKGYQPPPDEAASGTATPLAPPVAEAEKPVEKPKPRAKPKPKPKVARAPEPPRTTISVGLGKKPKPVAERQAGPAQTDWPAPPPTAAQAQPSQSVWPAPPSTASAPSQTVWPAPPPTGGSQQAAQPSQSIWPNPPPTTGGSR
jgi:outer membrane biosynthesis protein TonB